MVDKKKNTDKDRALDAERYRRKKSEQRKTSPTQPTPDQEVDS